MNDCFNFLKCGDPNDLSQRVTLFETKMFATLGDRCKDPTAVSSVAYCYKSCINSCAWTIYLWHFGFRGALTPKQILDKGTEMATGYFGVVRDELADRGLRPRSPMDVRWFNPYCESLLMATLGGHTDERTQFSDCLHANFTIEASAAPHTEAALGGILLCIAKLFQSSAMDTAAIEERLTQSRKKRPKLLFKAWQALQGGDREEFASALADSTANFAKTTADDTLPLNAVAVPESILAGIAYERGWTDLSFDLPIAARLVTHQSLGLA